MDLLKISHFYFQQLTSEILRSGHQCKKGMVINVERKDQTMKKVKVIKSINKKRLSF